jgi:hypothetical protein
VSLSDEAHERLADIVALQPTKNGELEDRWGLDSGKAVHQYLESELKEYYYRDESSLIRATPKAASLVGAPTGEEGATVFQLPPLQRWALAVLPEPEKDPASVVAVLHAIRADNEAERDSDAAGEADDEEAIDADGVRSALRSLERKGIVEVIRRTVPTFRLAVERDSIDVEPLE